MEIYHLILRYKRNEQGRHIGGKVVKGIPPRIGERINLNYYMEIAEDICGQYRVFDIEHVVGPNIDKNLESIAYVYAEKIENQGSK